MAQKQSRDLLSDRLSIGPRSTSADMLSCFSIAIYNGPSSCIVFSILVRLVYVCRDNRSRITRRSWPRRSTSILTKSTRKLKLPLKRTGAPARTSTSLSQPLLLPCPLPPLLRPFLVRKFWCSCAVCECC
jgi:hypothetical protein